MECGEGFTTFSATELYTYKWLKCQRLCYRYFITIKCYKEEQNPPAEKWGQTELRGFPKKAAAPLRPGAPQADRMTEVSHQRDKAARRCWHGNAVILTCSPRCLPQQARK